MRKIIHIDMDAFYASIEQRDLPELRGRPVVVGGDPKRRGVVCSASYEARRFGVRSAMSSAQAQRLCPQAAFILPNFSKYVEASQNLQRIFKEITSLVEPLALDEAYLDVTENALNEPIAARIASLLKKRIQDQLGLSSSAGVGPNKFIAKLASDHRKPDGLVVVPPERVFQFIEYLPVEKFWGVGPVTARKFNLAGVRTAADVRAMDIEKLKKIVGSSASFFSELAFGRDERKVEATWEAKSRGTESTFERDTTDSNRLLQWIEEHSQEVATDLQRDALLGKTVTVKIKYNDFKVITRSKTLLFPTNDAGLISTAASDLLFRDTEVGNRPVRLIGVSVSNLIAEGEEIQLWFEFP